MSLYDDYKNKQASDQENNKAVETTSGVAIDGEVYDVFHEPFYKKREFYALCIAVLVIATVLFFFLYTPKFEMEKLVGKEKSYVETYKETYDLQVSYFEDFNDDYNKGIVYEQSLKAGKEYKEGSILQVKISKGPDYSKKLSYPSFSEMTYDEAVEWRSANHASGTEIIKEYSDGVEENGFIKEDLGNINKSDFKRESSIKIYYSKGKAETATEVTVPDFKNKTLSEVASWARTNSITMNVIEIYDKYLTAGIVIEQNIANGAKIPKGGEISVTVALGEGVVVPDYGKYNEVTSASAESKIAANVETVYSSSVPKGRIISQSVPAGTRVKEGEKVDVVYSMGKVPIGNYVGMDYPTVANTIYELNSKGANITLQVVYWQQVEGTVAGTVASQNYVNMFMNPGDGITIAIYK